MEILKLSLRPELRGAVLEYAESCSWKGGQHLAHLIRERRFKSFEEVFLLTEEEKIRGFCTLSKWDYSPQRHYSPWITTIFVDENYRGKRRSEKMIEKAAQHAENLGYEKVYIQTDHVGLYEKFGFEKIDTITNYDGEKELVFVKEL